MRHVITFALVLAVAGAALAQDDAVSNHAIGFSGYPQAGVFSVAPREQPLQFFPCSACHQALPVNPQPRQIPIHPTLNHGRNRFWCLTCHNPGNRDQLHTIAAEPVEFDQAYLVCGQCHYNRQRDWYFGVHGKRQDNWRGERVIRNCTYCHNPHDPVIPARAPQPPPPVRKGLARQDVGADAPPRVWERHDDAVPQQGRGQTDE